MSRRRSVSVLDPTSLVRNWTADVQGIHGLLEHKQLYRTFGVAVLYLGFLLSLPLWSDLCRNTNFVHSQIVQRSRSVTNKTDPQRNTNFYCFQKVEMHTLCVEAKNNLPGMMSLIECRHSRDED